MKLAAIAAFALVGLAVAQTIRPIPDTQVRVVGEIPAEWWTFVYVEGGVASYAVPSDRHFVVTLCDPPNAISVNGQGFPFNAALQALARATSEDRNGTRVVIPGGSLIESTPGNGAYLWGYLEPVP